LLVPSKVGSHLPEASDKHIEILNQCAKWADEGFLKVHVSKVLPLSEAAFTHQLIEEGHTSGTLVLST